MLKQSLGIPELGPSGADTSLIGGVFARLCLRRTEGELEPLSSWGRGGLRTLHIYTVSVTLIEV